LGVRPGFWAGNRRQGEEFFQTVFATVLRCSEIIFSNIQEPLKEIRFHGLPVFARLLTPTLTNLYFSRTKI
jgi:hypothetical protein